jgi:homoserine kinase
MGMEEQSIRVFAPATVANVACGFDILGFALESPGDEVVLRLNGQNRVIITHISGDGGKLPLDPSKNTAGVAVLKMLESLNSKQGISIELHKNIGLGSGLGSSASSSVASAFALNCLLGEPFQTKELLPFTMEAERVACGSAHADNVAPSLLGGFVLVRSYDPLDVISLPYPKELYCTVIHPYIELRTEDSRNALPKIISLKDAVIQWGNIGGLISGLMMEDFSLISRSLRDVIAEPARAEFIPGFYEMKMAALESGALGCSISGSGPSVFALCRDKTTALEAGKNMRLVLNRLGTACQVYTSPIYGSGPQIRE